MLASDTREAWTQFLDFVKNRCSATAYGNWLMPIQVLEATSEEIVLEIPNIFVKEYLLSNYEGRALLFFPSTMRENLRSNSSKPPSFEKNTIYLPVC